MAEAQTLASNGVTWDLSSYFPAFNGPEMLAFKQQLYTDVALLQQQAAALGTLTSDNAAGWEDVCLKAEDFDTRMGHIFSYVGCLSSADAANEDYNQEESRLMQLGAERQKFQVEVQHGFRDATDEVFAAFVERPQLQEIAHSIRRIREKARQTMPREQELLAADLGVDGFHSWGQLYDTLTGKLEFDMVYPDGRQERVPISKWRSMISDVDRSVGRAAFECGNKAWEGVADVCAAALNAIAGTRLVLNKHRGISHFLENALFQSQIKQASLDAMYKAIYDNIGIAREILVTKARFMGRAGIAWHEKEAPLPLKDEGKFSWADGSAMVGTAFRTAYPALADYYADFLDKRWLESEARGGKRPGAYCTGSEFTGEQRVYMTFNGALGDVTTLAHEMGHAWHGHLLKDLRPAAQNYPMTLAETASIFAEGILAEGVYTDSRISDDQKLQMLDADLSGAAILLLDITVRYEFEKAFYEERAQGPVSVSRLKQLMVETQKRVWGPALAEGGEDPLFWASKLHFYITGVSFYNFPYTFGFLLAQTLAALFREQGPPFLAKYEEFLRLTGSDTVENVVQRTLGQDTTQPEFWVRAIESLKQPLKQYQELLAKR